MGTRAAVGAWGSVLGFALGGFFDGILLHQILQWHHLLSLVPSAGDLRFQVLWDGYFHALMYVVAAVGMFGLWRAQRSKGRIGGRRLMGAILVGFGLWHAVDGVLSHLLLGIHRIRLDAANPLVWDLMWFFAFGMVPIAVGWLLIKSRTVRTAPPNATWSILMAALVTGAAAWAAIPPPDQRFTTVAFAPDVQPHAVMAAIANLDARLVWADPAMGVVVVDVPDDRGWEFYAAGALFVSGSGPTAGCLTWARI